jgi:hypothetical protein
MLLLILGRLPARIILVQSNPVVLEIGRAVGELVAREINDVLLVRAYLEVMT